MPAALSLAAVIKPLIHEISATLEFAKTYPWLVIVHLRIASSNDKDISVDVLNVIQFPPWGGEEFWVFWPVRIVHQPGSERPYFPTDLAIRSLLWEKLYRTFTLRLGAGGLKGEGALDPSESGSW
jgi:hypothetical protein